MSLPPTVKGRFNSTLEKDSNRNIISDSDKKIKFNLKEIPSLDLDI